jgi:hypothetical protein
VIQVTRTQMNTNVSLSQATKSLEWDWDLEMIWSFVLCLGVKSRALVLNAMAENLDALKCGGWGVFIAPPTKMAVGEVVCRWAHRRVRCATGHCSLLQTTVGAVAVASHGTSDSLVAHRTVLWIIAEWPSKNLKLSSSELISLVHQTLSDGAPDSPVRQTKAAFDWFCSFLFEPYLGLFIGLCWTFCTCRTYNLEQTS